MENFLVGFIFIIGIIVITSIVNERKLHLHHDIALVLVPSLVSCLIIILQKFNLGGTTLYIDAFKDFKFDTFVLECLLGFMFFASASKIHLNKFVNNIAPIISLASVNILVYSILYGLIFYLVSIVLNLDFNILVCFLLGSILSLTDSVATIDILKKSGISKSFVAIMEGESLLGDGVVVTLYVFLSSIIKNGISENFFLILIKEIFGAIIVGLVVSWLLFKLIKLTNKPIIHILISLLTVSLSYVVCEHYGFSGVIASVVCGMYFSYKNKKIARWKEVVDSKDLYNDFWNIAESLLNGILYVLVGLSVVSMEIDLKILILIPIAIILNLLSRGLGVSISTIILGKKNVSTKYSFKHTVSLLTWSGLKGGASLALVIATREILTAEQYMIMFNSTLVTILFTTIVQGLFTNRVYKYIETKRDEKALIKRSN